MMVDPLSIGPVAFFGLKVGRSPVVVKEQFPFRSAGSIPGFDCQSLARSRSRAGVFLFYFVSASRQAMAICKQ
jgi:hypothetical protein